VTDTVLPSPFSTSSSNAGNDLSRENIKRQATNLRRVELDNLLPGVTLNTSPTNYYPIGQMQMYRFDGQHQAPFGEIISVAGS
jgi:branched-chain amino acid transport system substrate-binding protein